MLVKHRQEAEHIKICLQCNSKAPVTLRTCKVCKGKLARLEVSTEESQQEKVNPYSHFKAKEKSNAIKVMVGEPDMLNPNSFENLSVILWSLGQHTKITKYSSLISETEGRKWVFIENDGSILNAQIYAKKGGDHHKFWDLLEIVYIALTNELLVEFVRFCIRNNMEPSGDNYWSSFSKKGKKIQTMLFFSKWCWHFFMP